MLLNSKRDLLPFESFFGMAISGCAAVIISIANGRVCEKVSRFGFPLTLEPASPRDVVNVTFSLQQL
jgi:hypothetical protein